MPLYQAVILATIQGLTEFLPVSSTAHLALFPWLLHWDDPGLTYDVALHAGTLVAVLAYFRRTWIDLVTDGLSLRRSADSKAGENRRLFWLLVVGTIPAAAAGWAFERAAETKLRNPMLIAAALIVVGLVMWAGDRLKTHSHSLGEVNLVDSLVVGAAQAFAVIPGVSRSGATMTAGLFRGMTRETAARFSFLLSTPVIAGAALKRAMELRYGGFPDAMRLPFLVGIGVASVVGYMVIAALMRYLATGTFKIFVVYRIALGVVVLLAGWGLHLV